MNYLAEKIILDLKTRLKEAMSLKYPDFSLLDSDFALQKPPQPEMGDFCLVCFDLAKKIKINPADLARNLVEQLKANGNLEKVNAYGPYLNLFLNKAKFTQAVLSDLQNKIKSLKKKKEKVMIEGFGQANTHKAFHIGHLRNICLSESIANLLEFSGYRVRRANYQGDIGTHVAKWLWYFVNYYQGEIAKKDIGKWLTDIYLEANAELEKNPEKNQAVAEVLKKLESSDKKLNKIWKKTRVLSLKEFARLYKILGVKIDDDFFESKQEKPGKKIVAQLLKQGLAKKSEGAVIVDLEKYNLGIFLILKSDGTSLYSTKDLALAQEKFKKYQITQSIYITDERQSFYFKQLFKTLELMGFSQASQCRNLTYGLVSLAGSVIMSRAGNLVLFEELYEVTRAKLRQEIAKREKVPPKEREKIAHQLTLGALKFAMLKSSPETAIDFNWEKAFQFEGDTGPYLQYAYARIQSIIRKLKTKNQKLKTKKNQINFSLLNKSEEWGLIKLLYEFNSTIRKSAQDYNPSLLANYLLELAGMFNSFYQKYPVLKAESKELKIARIFLIGAVSIVLKRGLKLLGIDVCEKM